jgi:hypothetical protein
MKESESESESESELLCTDSTALLVTTLFFIHVCETGRHKSGAINV